MRVQISIEFHLMSPGGDFLQTHMAREKATRLQRRADRKTMTRYHGALPLSAVMAATRSNWMTAIANAGLWHTDHTDGKDAKKARSLWPNLPRTNASTKDPEADKRLQYGNRAAILARACVAGDWETAGIIAAETVVSVVRDKRMGGHRRLAETHDIETDAININRVKTAMIAVGEVVALSPLAENDMVRRVALGTICVGTLVGVVGAEQYGQQVRAEIASRG